MDVNFIKWMCDKAEGFEAVTGKNRFNCSMGIVSISDTGYFKIIYPLLLQRAIEGVNKEDERIVIVIDDCLIDVISYKFTKNFNIEDLGIDNAKESALLYIYNQELDKNKEVK